MKTRAYILLLIINLLVVISYAQKIDSTNIDSLLQVKFDAYYPKTFSLEDSVFEEGEIMILNIEFYYGKVAVHEDSYYLLDSLVSFLNKYNVRILISHHTDVRGKELYNSKLSEFRSRVVYEYLEKKGVDSTRMNYLGEGESELIISKEETLNLSSKILQEKAHALNRRTEFKIISIE